MDHLLINLHAINTQIVSGLVEEVVGSDDSGVP